MHEHEHEGEGTDVDGEGSTTQGLAAQSAVCSRPWRSG